MAVIVEMNIGMVRQQRHGHRSIHQPLGYHQRREPHAKGIVVMTEMPNGNFFRFPSLHRADHSGLVPLPHCRRWKFEHSARSLADAGRFAVFRAADIPPATAPGW